jgi:hypothetical protein
MGYSRHRVYDDFLDLMTYSLQRDDESYLEVVERYDNEREKGEREIDHFTYAFGLLQEGMNEVGHDLLGVVYEEMGHSSDAFGQHFTPHNLCDAKAEMILSDVDEDRDELYTVQDPASGSGRLLISAAKKLPDTVEAEFYGVDKDSTCAKMTALNLTFFNMDGYAVQGDSLKMDYRRVWQTQGSALGGELVELEQDEWDNPYEQKASDVDETSETAEVDLVPDSEDVDEDEGVVDFQDLRETTLSDFTERGENQ